MCRAPVTLGGGITMVKGSREESACAVKAPWRSQNE